MLQTIFDSPQIRQLGNGRIHFSLTRAQLKWLEARLDQEGADQVDLIGLTMPTGLDGDTTITRNGEIAVEGYTEIPEDAQPQYF